jgi:kynurenine formamidase
MGLPPEFTDLAASVRNWGRWGPDDELGTVNLVTPEVHRRAAACVRTGKAFSLALPLSESEGIQVGYIPGRINPVRTMTQLHSPIFSDDPEHVRSNDDLVVMALQCATHWDGLAHVSYRGHIWNGYPADTVTSGGATRCGIHRIRTLVSRGVLLDVARARGVDRLEGGHAITGDDLDAAEKMARVRVESGDIVLVRTGQMAVLRERGGKRKYPLESPGLSMQSVPWLRHRDVAAVATDTFNFEVFPGEREDVFLPVHMLHLVDMGLTQGQNWVLDELAADCADDGVYEFLLEASPQPFTHAVGSPVNPVALK